MSLWSRVRSLLGGRELIVPDEDAGDMSGEADAPAPEPPAPATASTRAEDEWLADQVARAAAGDAAQAGSPAFFARIEALVASGHDLAAAEWLDKFAVATPPGDARVAIRRRAAELRQARGEHAEARPHLEALVHAPAHAAWAHFQLAEQHRAARDLRLAQRHLERCLALDVEFVNARPRLDAIRAELGAAAPAPPAVDETLAGPGVAHEGARYRLVRQLGRGATGTVYLARDADLDREVAVKLLHPHLGAAARREAVARFFAEARTAAALRHPNIIAILDLDEAEKRIVMEVARGGTLRERLVAGPLPPAVALDRHVDVLAALLAAHRLGVVHRDLKPANLLFRDDPASPAAELVLCDFGIAHLGPARGSTAAAEAEGTLLYMAPEQRRGDPGQPQGDLYTAAVILHETLTGRLPWSREEALRGTHATRPLDAPAVPALDPELAAALARHIAHLSAPDPAHRPGTAEALASALSLVDLQASVASGQAARFRADRARHGL